MSQIAAYLVSMLSEIPGSGKWPPLPQFYCWIALILEKSLSTLRVNLSFCNASLLVLVLVSGPIWNLPITSFTVNFLSIWRLLLWSLLSFLHSGKTTSLHSMPSFQSPPTLVALCHRCRAWMDPFLALYVCPTGTKVVLVVLTIVWHCWCVFALMVQQTSFLYSDSLYHEVFSILCVWLVFWT